MDSCFYSSIVFLILALLLDNFSFKILFLFLCITSSIFHLYDHEIYPQREIYNIYYYDMLSILCIALYIITNNITYSIVITLIIIILFQKINRFSVCFYLATFFLVATFSRPFFIIMHVFHIDYNQIDGRLGIT